MRAKSGELIVADAEGIWKARSVMRRPIDERWNLSNLEMVKCVPWSEKGDKKDEGQPEPEGVKMSEAEAAKETECKEAIPRSLYIRANDLREHGYTSGCPGCTSIIRGRVRQGHSKACPERIEKILKDTDRHRAAEERVNRYCAERLQEQEEEQRKKKSKSEHEGDQETKTEREGSQGPKVGADEPTARSGGDGVGSRGAAAGSSGDGAVLREDAEEQGEARKRANTYDGDDGSGELGDRPKRARVIGGVEDEGDDDGGEAWDDLDDEEGGKEELDPEEVKRAREEEIEELERRVYEEVDVEEAWSKTGKAPIGVKWVDVKKKEGIYQSRLVAQGLSSRTPQAIL